MLVAQQRRATEIRLLAVKVDQLAGPAGADLWCLVEVVWAVVQDTQPSVRQAPCQDPQRPPPHLADSNDGNLPHSPSPLTGGPRIKRPCQQTFVTGPGWGLDLGSRLLTRPR